MSFTEIFLILKIIRLLLLLFKDNCFYTNYSQNDVLLHSYHFIYFQFQVTTLNLEIVRALARGSVACVLAQIFLFVSKHWVSIFCFKFYASKFMIKLVSSKLQNVIMVAAWHTYNLFSHMLRFGSYGSYLFPLIFCTCLITILTFTKWHLLALLSWAGSLLINMTLFLT